MAKPNQQTDHGDPGRATDESTLSHGEAESRHEEMTDDIGFEPEVDSADETDSRDDATDDAVDGETVASQSESESDWGFAKKKKWMSRETKIGLAFILILSSALSFVVYTRISRNTGSTDTPLTVAPSADDSRDAESETHPTGVVDEGPAADGIEGTSVAGNDTLISAGTDTRTPIENDESIASDPFFDGSDNQAQPAQPSQPPWESDGSFASDNNAFGNDGVPSDPQSEPQAGGGQNAYPAVADSSPINQGAGAFNQSQTPNGERDTSNAPETNWSSDQTAMGADPFDSSADFGQTAEPQDSAFANPTVTDGNNQFASSNPDAEYRQGDSVPINGAPGSMPAETLPAETMSPGEMFPGETPTGQSLNEDVANPFFDGGSNAAQFEPEFDAGNSMANPVEDGGHTPEADHFKDFQSVQVAQQEPTNTTIVRNPGAEVAATEPMGESAAFGDTFSNDFSNEANAGVASSKTGVGEFGSDTSEFNADSALSPEPAMVDDFAQDMSIQETPFSNDEPFAEEQPLVQDEPFPNDKPIAEEQPLGQEEPFSNDEPFAGEQPLPQDEPFAQEEPFSEDQPLVQSEPSANSVMLEEPEAIEGDRFNDAPANDSIADLPAETPLPDEFEAPIVTEFGSDGFDNPAAGIEAIRPVPEQGSLSGESKPASIDGFDREPVRVENAPQVPGSSVKSAPVKEDRPVLGSDTYVVQSGDNYWRISQKVYGTARYFEALAQLNRKTVSNPQRMRPGTTIRTPAASVLAAQFAKLVPKAATPLRSTVTAKPVTKPAANTSQGFFVDSAGQPKYRVGTTDTLTDISRDHLGRSSRWIQIFEMNRDRLRNPHDLKIGTILRLPADASRLEVVQNVR